MHNRLLHAALVVCPLLLLTAWASADTVRTFGLDLNSVQVQATLAGGANGFGAASHTGQLSFSGDANASAAITIDGAFRQAFIGPLMLLDGSIDFANGLITGGQMRVGVRQTPSTAFDTYNFDLMPVGGLYQPPWGLGGWTVMALTTNGFFSGPGFATSTFGGIDISAWNQVGLLDGEFMTFRFEPDDIGFDGAADVEVMTAITAVPLPAAVWGGFAIFGVMLAGRVKSRRN